MALLLLSPQKKLAEAEAEALAARRELNAFDGEMDEAWPMISRMFRAAGSRLWLALPPALLASLPIVALIVWLSNDYGYRFPAENVHVPAEAAPARYHAAVTGAGDQDRRVLVREPEGEIVSDVPLAAPVPVIEKHRWWNWLIANPTGYLPADAPVERVEVRLPALEVVPFGPSWMRGWEALFLHFSSHFPSSSRKSERSHEQRGFLFRPFAARTSSLLRPGWTGSDAFSTSGRS